MIRLPGFSPLSLPLSSLPLSAIPGVLEIRRLCWGEDRIPIAGFLDPSFLSRGAHSSLYRLSLSLWLSWFSCAYLCRGESAHFPWATWAVAYSTCSIHYSSSIHFQNLPSSHRTSSVLTIINLHKNVFVFFYDYFSRLSEGKGNNMWVQSAIFLWNAIG